MKFLKDYKNQMDFDKENLLELDDKDLTYIVEYIVKNPYTDYYDDFYISKYSSDTTTAHRNASEYFETMERITQKSNHLIQSQVQSNSQSYFYTYMLGGRQDEKLRYRIYLAPNPENLHYIAEQFAKNTYKRGINVEFKIQRQNDAKKKKMDRMVVYCTTRENLIACLDVFDKIQKGTPQAFYGAEKSPIWYRSQVKNVYIAPEIMQEGRSYGSVFEESANEMVALLKYLCDCKNLRDYERKLTPSEKEAFYDFAKTILRSSLLKNSCCIRKNYDNIYKKAEPSYLLLNDGRLRSSYLREDGSAEMAIFEKSREGKRVLLNNFYTTPRDLGKSSAVTVKDVTGKDLLYKYH